MSRRPSSSHLSRSAPIACLAAFFLASCAQDGPPPLPPLPEEAMSAVVVDPGVSRVALARAVDELFTSDGMGETRAVIVMRNGEVVAERYADEFGPEVRHIGWSMSKTVTGVLIGMMVADGRLRLDDPAPVPAWQRSGDPRGEITLRYLLQMRSGLRHDEGADPVYDSAEVRMMYLDGRDDMAAWAEAQPLEHEPGSTFDYSTPTSVILSDIATQLIAPDAPAAERQQTMADFVDARLAVPLGMGSLVGEYDPAGTLTGGSSFWATARDWAVFGEFLRNGGSVSGAQIVPRGWIDFMRTSSPASPDYGAQLWLNRDSGAQRDYMFADQGPDTAFAMMGHLGQYVIVSPEQRLTVVRLGISNDAERALLMDELTDIFALYPSE
ncbi:beta-lactamase [Aurantiacibacter marinus]|uniref:Beta-lactamase n=2 Tax=Aurantiacibacter marinus TaxID=874156 RepID=A0A0H0XQ87_9SPHN|nr:beta-lactamase [Aurantiacibacter marinus]